MRAATLSAVKRYPEELSYDRFHGYWVKVDIFEGPLDLLLYLIKENEADIFDIPIAQITDQYLAFLRIMEDLNVEIAADFIVMAATLLVIKSKMLLPPEEEPEEGEEEPGEDPRAELARRLAEYRRYKEAAEKLKSAGDLRSLMFSRPSEGEQEEGQRVTEILLMRDVSLFDLLGAFREVLQRVTERPGSTIRRDPVTVEDKIREISRRLRGTPEGLSFHQLCDTCETRLEVICIFLALLELVRRGRIAVVQQQSFGPILIRERVAASSARRRSPASQPALAAA